MAPAGAVAALGISLEALTACQAEVARLRGVLGKIAGMAHTDSIKREDCPACVAGDFLEALAQPAQESAAAGRDVCEWHVHREINHYVNYRHPHGGVWGGKAPNYCPDCGKPVSVAAPPKPATAPAASPSSEPPK